MARGDAVVDDFADLGGLDDLPDLDTLLDFGEGVDAIGDAPGLDLFDGMELPDPFGEETTTEAFGVFEWFGEYELFVPDWDPQYFDGVGDPIGLADLWFLQDGENACAVATQTMVLNAVTGLDFDEATLAEIAEAQGWFDPDTGTHPFDVGRILDHHGLQTETSFFGDITDLVEALDRGDHVLAGVNAQEIWQPLRDVDGLPVDQASMMHSVWVTGVDQTPDGSYYVILNDPGDPDGRLMPVALEDFLNAWEDSGNHLVLARGDIEGAA